MVSRNIVVTKLNVEPMDQRQIELVERKGHGHPDYIADSIAEAVSRELSRYYLEEYGAILHHNVDKVLVVGGQVERWFGGGRVVQPIYILVAGRATVEVEHEGKRSRVPIGPLILKASKEWLRSNFREKYLDVEKHVVIDYRIGQGSVDLRSVYEARYDYPLANDTSVGVAFAPLSETERLVKTVEEELYSLRAKIPAIGEDIKVMGLRRGDTIKLTVAVAIMAQEVNNLEEYTDIKERVKDIIEKEIAPRITQREVIVNVNTADRYDKEGRGVYLVVTGTSAEHGDDGATGRGNRVNGLITPFRPMSLEAAAGKNPVSHVGKLYNVVAQRAAERIASLEGVEEAYVEILSSIGVPINQPQIAHVGLVVSDEQRYSALKKEAETILEEELDNIVKLREEFVSENPPPVF